ncbi:MAG: protein-disulfide reductase DsbD family protein [Candidatus Aminicenantes bacterium]|nr:protein-disulfide reductase DsbD family protein [Candidatus Aminicenantes bacterium]
MRNAIRRIVRTCGAGWVWVLLILPAQAQDQVRFELLVDSAEVPAGEVFEAKLRAELAPGWHIYSLNQPPPPVKTSVTVVEESSFEAAGPVTQPTPIVAYDPSFDIDTEYFEEQVDFGVPVRVRSSTGPGAETLGVKVRFMVCSDTLCLPPQTKGFEAAVRVAEARATAGSPPADTQEAEPAPAPVVQEEPSGAASSDAAAAGDAGGIPVETLGYIAFAMGMGALALLTPCVFPMIPITVSYFTKRQAVSRGQAVRDASLYSLGIILTFTLLGFGLTFLFGSGGINRLAANPGINLLIAAIFVAFALSLFEVLELRLPASWTTALDRKASATGGIAGILLMALTFSLVSFTCTVPFVGTLMVAAIQGDWLWSLLGVTSFAVVFSSPFFLLALFPSWLKSLPRSGNWLNSVKITMGFLEVAFAFKFLSNVDLVYQWELLTRPGLIAIWLAISVMILFYLLGWFRFPHEQATESIGVSRAFFAVFFAAISIHLIRGLIGFPLGELDAFLPPRDYGNPASVVGSLGEGAGEELEWIDDYESGLASARESGKPVFIDFTGYTCTNCRWMEANVFTLPKVQERLRQYLLVRLYTDGTGPEHTENMRLEQERFGTIALPFYVVLSPEDEVVATFPGLTRNPEEFIDFLDRGLEANRSGQAG